MEDTLMIGGHFEYADTLFAGNIYGFYGGTCLQMGMPMGNDNSMLGTNGDVLGMLDYNGKIFVGGQFTASEGFPYKFVSYIFANNFGPADHVINNTVRCFAIYKNELYAGGDFVIPGSLAINHIAKWNGTTWLPLKNGTNGNVRALCVYNNYLVAAGDFDRADNQYSNHIARWDGTNWSALGGGLSSDHFLDSLGLKPTVNSLMEYNGNLFAGGRFRKSDTTTVTNIAKWNDTLWSSSGIVGARSSDVIKCFAVYNNRLISGGYFSRINNADISNIAAWDGSTWSSMGNGTDSTVESLALHDDNLVVGGDFRNANGINSPYIAWYREHTSGLVSPPNSVPGIKVFPNPSTGQLTVRFPSSLIMHNYYLFNQTGVQIQTGYLKPGCIEIYLDMRRYSNGLYFLKTDSPGIIPVKIMVNK